MTPKPKVPLLTAGAAECAAYAAVSAGHSQEVFDQLKAIADSQAVAVEVMMEKALRDEFEHWYITNAFDYARDPIGSRDCHLQWKAQLALARAKGIVK